MKRVRRLGRGLQALLGLIATIGLTGILSVVLLSKGPGVLAAPQVTLNFDEHFDSTFIPENQYISSGVLFSSMNGGQAFVYADHEAPSVLSDPNGSAFSTPSMLCGGNPANVGLRANFVSPGTLTLATANFVRVNVSSGPGPDLLSSNVALIAYDAGGNVIATDPANTSLQFDTLTVSVSGIARVDMPAGGDLDCYDDFTFALEGNDADGDGVLDDADECPAVAGDPDYAGCPTKKHAIKFMTFIPSNYIDAGVLSRLAPIPLGQPNAFDVANGTACVSLTGVHRLIGAGDDRGYDHSASASGRYRTLQAATLVVVQKGTTKEYKLENAMNDSGISESYVKDAPFNEGALNHGTPGVIDATDNDGTLGDCKLKHASHPGSEGDMVIPSVDRLNNNTARITLKGSAKNGLIPVSPSIKWDMTVDVNTAQSSPRVTVRGTRVLFPAYEVYVNNHPVYRAAPTGLSASQLPVRFFGFADVSTLFVPTTITPTQTTVPQS